MYDTYWSLIIMHTHSSTKQLITYKIQKIFQYHKREQEIINYKNYKLKMEEERAEMEKRHKAATKIQAWWRGTMVRKGFGQYKKKKDKKLKKKSSEKNLLKNV